MDKDYESQPYVSPEQEKLMHLVIDLSSGFSELIVDKRSNALTALLDESNSSDTKKRVLAEYFSFRMAPESYTISLNNGEQYYLSDLQKCARKLNDDRTFAYGDEPIILKNLNFYVESLTIDDVVLAYHFYRLCNKTDESLSHFVKLIGYYTKYAFTMDGIETDYCIPNGILPHEDAIDLMKRILSFVDDYLKEYENKTAPYEKRFELEKMIRLDFASRVERDLDQALSKISPVEIRLKKLEGFFASCKGYNWDYDITLGILLAGLYGDIDFYNNGAMVHAKTSSSGLAEPPTLLDLIDLARKGYEIQKQFDKENKQPSNCSLSYKRVYDFLNNLLGSEAEVLFNQISAITEEDEIQARQNNETVALDSVFENIGANLPFLFVIANAAESIPEFSIDKDAVKWRKRICRQFCAIYANGEGYEIEDDKRINAYKLAESERIIDANKAALFKSFLMMYQNRSIEDILRTRLELLDRAKEIAPEDTAFLEECSSEILALLQKAIDTTEDITSLVIKLRIMLEPRERRILSEKVLHTLATAELLFSRYADETYADQGFDYSCISALYYQAFENAYNELIWSKYANMLNKELTFDKNTYCATIKNHYHHIKQQKKDKSEIAITSDYIGFGYLPCQEKNWYYYIDNNSKQVSETCMYGSFSKLLDEKKYPREQIPQFYCWLARLFGFTSDKAMIQDKAFMSIFNTLQRDMSVATWSRNNASHGGSETSLNQCRNDKRTVLSDLQETRETTLGLINQLVGLCSYNHCLSFSDGRKTMEN